MKNSNLDTLRSINRSVLKKVLAVIAVAVVAVGMFAALSPATVTADASSMALHTSGQLILDQNGNTVYLRGMGLAGFAPNLLLWGQDGSDNWGDQWNTNSTQVMDQTFAALRDQWHINMIRVFVLPSWYYRDSIVPAVEDPSSYSSLTTPLSTRMYLRTLCEEAGKYGIYVDVTPYMLTPSTSSFGSDPYASTGYGWQGMPLMGWDQAATNFLKDAGYGSNEQAFWSWFWTDMANNLKDYPNAIFEAWNEPNVGSDTDAIPAGYMTYLQTMYTAIRQTGASNIVMMQWHMGWQPNGYGNTLAWASQIDNAIHPVNIVYTTHFYYYAPTDLTSYWATDQAGLKTQVQTAIASMGVSAPLVINEEGSCMSSSQNRQNDLTWWTNLVSAQRDLGVGACAYYWLSDGGLGGVYSGETMLSGGYTPNSMGQAYIDAYVPSAVSQAVSVVTPSPTVEPTATPTPAVTLPTEQPSTEPTQTAEPTPEPAQTETSTTQPTSEPTTAFPDEPTINHAPTYTAKPTSTAQPTTQPSAEAPQTQSQKGTPILDGNWLFFNWIRYNLWFSVRYW